MKNNLNVMYKGLLIGSTMLVPGVSGGSMAMILGIYDRLISSVSSFTKNIKDNLRFLSLFVLSAGVGMILLAKPILSLLETYPKPMSCFFVGAAAGGIPAIYMQTQVKKISWNSFLYLLLGIAIVTVIAVFPIENFMWQTSGNTMSSLFLLAAGLIAAIGLVLPGISVSYLLLVMGLYEELMRAISELDIAFLFPIGSGVLVGILLVTKGLEYIMKKYPHITYFVILGFVLGSLIEVLPQMPVGIEWIFCIAAVAAGYFFISNLSDAETKGVES